MKEYSFRQFNKILKKNGYVEVRTVGDHHIYKKSGVCDNVTITEKPNITICQRYIKTHNLVVC